MSYVTMSTPLEDCGYDLPTRVKRQLSWAGYKTLGDVADVPDHKLLMTHNFGKTSLKQLREYISAVKTRQVKAELEQAAAKRAENADVVAWAIAHPTLIRALMAREVVIVPRKGESNGVHS